MTNRLAVSVGIRPQGGQFTMRALRSAPAAVLELIAHDLRTAQSWPMFARLYAQSRAHDRLRRPASVAQPSA
jgi:hypothetical protein